MPFLTSNVDTWPRHGRSRQLRLDETAARPTARHPRHRHRPAGRGRGRATACGGRIVLLVATVLGAAVVDAGLAVHAARSEAAGAYWRSLVVLNCSYWYLWALFTPAIVWLSQHFRFERRGLLARASRSTCRPSCVFSFGAHRRDGRPCSWWLATRRAASLRVVVGGPALGAPELRLGDDDLLGHRRPQPRAPLLPRVARPRAARRRSSRRSSSRRSSTTLQQQLHPHFLFNTLHAISALMHKDVRGRRPHADAAERSAPAHARAPRPAGGDARGGARVPVEVPRDRADPLRRSPRRPLRHPARNAGRLRAEPAAAAARRERHQARRGPEVRARATSTSPRAARATSCGSRCATTASGCRRTR